MVRRGPSSRASQRAPSFAWGSSGCGRRVVPPDLPLFPPQRQQQQHLSPVLSPERPGQLARVLKGFSVGRCRFPSEPCEQLARTPVGKTPPSSSGAPDLTDRIKARGSISLCLTKPGKQLKCIWGTEWCQSNSEWMIHPSYQFHCTTGNRRRQTKGKERAE